MERIAPLLLALLLTLSPAVRAAEGGGAVRVGAIDSGILATHPALEGVAIEQGENFVFQGASSKDLLGHGTRISHLIADQCPAATLVPLAVASRYPSGLQAVCGPDVIAKAIVDAIDRYGCRVLNLSIGVTEDGQALRDAAAYAEERVVLLVAAVGNGGITAPGARFFPAAYDAVVAIGAVDGSGIVAPFSQAGYPFVCARGVDVEVLSFGFSIVPPKVSGTSCATATVTGLAAELLHRNPDWSARELRDALRNSARSESAGYDSRCGWGVVA